MYRRRRQSAQPTPSLYKKDFLAFTPSAWRSAVYNNILSNFVVSRHTQLLFCSMLILLVGKEGAKLSIDDSVTLRLTDFYLVFWFTRFLNIAYFAKFYITRRVYYYICVDVCKCVNTKWIMISCLGNASLRMCESSHITFLCRSVRSLAVSQD